MDTCTFGNFLRRFWMIWLLIILLFGAVGSVKGASVESKLSSDVVNEIPDESEAGVTLPYLTGTFGLASQQNLWVSFLYAGAGMAAGGVTSLLVFILLYYFRTTRWFKALEDILLSDM